jgi:hypothetical protein
VASAQLVQEERSHMLSTKLGGCRLLAPPGSYWRAKGVPTAQSRLTAQCVLILATEIWVCVKGRPSLARPGVPHMLR